MQKQIFQSGISAVGVIFAVILIVIVAGAVYFYVTQIPRESEDLPASLTPESLQESTVNTTDSETDPKGAGEEAPLKSFSITGSNFAFSQDVITVKRGDRVRIEFESIEGLHDWVVSEFEAQTERVNVGEKTSVEFVADKTGTFEYFCSVGSHRQLGMVGTLIVE